MVWVIQFIIKLIMGCSWQNDLKMVCLAKSLRSTLFDMNRAEISDENCHVWPSSCHEKKKTVLQNALRKTFFDHDWAATSNKVFWHEFSIAKCSAFRVIWQCRLGWNQSSQMLLNALFNERLGWIVHYSTWNRQKSVMISWKIALPGHPFKIRQTRWTCTKFVFSSFHFLYKQTGPTVACTSTLNQSGLDTASAILATWKWIS